MTELDKVRQLTAQEIAAVRAEWADGWRGGHGSKPSHIERWQVLSLLDEVERTRAQKRVLRLALSAIADEEDKDDEFEARLARCTAAAATALAETGPDAGEGGD